MNSGKIAGSTKLDSLEIEMIRYRDQLDEDFHDRWSEQNSDLFKNLEIKFVDRYENVDVESPREFNERLFQDWRNQLNFTTIDLTNDVD